MATEKQIAANQRNAALSTGPKTDEGKALSRANAVTHGLTSDTLVPLAQKEACARRLSAWTTILKPEDELQEFDLKTAVEASLRMENCRDRELERRIDLAAVATSSDGRWETARVKEAAKLARSLKRNPEEVALLLRTTAAGREWLIASWRVLLQAVAEGEMSVWCEARTSEARDLLGMPKPHRDPLDRAKLFTDPSTIRAMILKEIATLEAEQVNSDAEDARLRSLHANGLIFETDASLVLIRRYETAAQREYHRSLKTIKQAKASPKPTRFSFLDAPRETSSHETNPIPATPIARVEPVTVTREEAADCETKPIPRETPNYETKPNPTPAARSIRASDLMPQVNLTAAVTNTQPLNRRLRRKLERESRRQEHLVRGKPG